MNINREYISKQNTYTGKNSPKYIVVHETDNYRATAGAETHASAQSKGHLSTSVHYYCGSDGVYQAAEHSDGTYSIGREYGGNHAVRDAHNKNSINIEICVNEDGDYSVARANAIELVKYLIQTTGIPAERVIRHYDAKGKYCPRKMMDNPALWEDFREQISGQAATGTPGGTSDSASGNTSAGASASAYLPGMYKVKADDLNIRTGPGTGYTVCGVIRDHGAYTMTEMKGSWGKLKSGAGWINCHEKYCTYLDGAGTVERRVNPYPVPTRTIRYIKGQPTMKGDDVRWVQWELVEAGYDIETDGSFGPASGKALLAYQAQHDLEQDGKCGPATRACMQED